MIRLASAVLAAAAGFGTLRLLDELTGWWTFAGLVSAALVAASAYTICLAAAGRPSAADGGRAATPERAEPPVHRC